MRIDEDAKILWEYHHLNHRLRKADAILVFGSHDLRVATYAAKLFIDGYAPFIVFSGGIAHQDDLLATGWKGTEASVMAQEAIRCGVPNACILLEEKARNSGENITFTRALLAKHKKRVQRVLVVHKPYMERRAHAALKKQWPRVRAVMTSPPIPFEQYADETISHEQFINILVGDTQRIKVYGEKGFQAVQRIPKKVWDAYERLVAAGYTKHLINT